MEDTATEASMPTLQTKSSRKSHTGVKKTMTRFRPNRKSHGYWRRCTKKANTNMQNVVIQEKGISVNENADCSTTAEKEDDKEKAEVDRKMKALQSIVPGGDSFGVDELFQETAGYIMALQYQVKTMRALTSYFQKIEKENRKFGG